MPQYYAQNNLFMQNPLYMAQQDPLYWDRVHNQQQSLRNNSAALRREAIISGLEGRIRIEELRKKLKETLPPREPYIPTPTPIPESFSVTSPSEMLEAFFDKNLRVHTNRVTGNTTEPNLVATLRATAASAPASDPKASEYANKMRERHIFAHHIIKSYEGEYLRLIKEEKRDRNEAAFEIMQCLEAESQAYGHILTVASGRKEPDRKKLTGSFNELMQYRKWVPDNTDTVANIPAGTTSYQPDEARAIGPASVITGTMSQQDAVASAISVLDKNIALIERAEQRFKYKRTVISSEDVSGDYVASYLKKLRRDMADGTLRNGEYSRTSRDNYSFVLPVAKNRLDPDLGESYERLESALKGPLSKTVTAQLADDIAHLADAFTAAVPEVQILQAVENPAAGSTLPAPAQSSAAGKPQGTRKIPQTVR